MSKLHTLIKRAIDHHGSQAKLAEKMGCSQQQIAYLLKAKTITAEMAIKMDVATGGEVSRHELRPDLSSIFISKDESPKVRENAA